VNPISIAVPDGWQELVQEPDEDGFVPLVLSPTEWPEEFGFRPSISVLSAPPEDPAPSPDVVGTEAIAAVLAQPGSRVLAYDLWRGDSGRRLVFAHLLGRTAVIVTQHLLVHLGRRVTISTSVDTDRYLRVSPALDEALAGLRLAEAD
jgi:hypothetical protein